MLPAINASFLETFKSARGQGVHHIIRFSQREHRMQSLEWHLWNVFFVLLHFKPLVIFSVCAEHAQS